MNVVVAVVDTYVQTEQCFDNIVTSSPMDMSISDINCEASVRTTLSSTISNNLVSINTVELPYYR